MRISATDVDALRFFLGQEDGDLARLLAQLRREAEPTEAMRAGTALHNALETADAGDFATLEADGYTFDLDFAAEVSLPEIREMKATREYVIDGTPVTLVGKVDAIHGRTVFDHKMTGRFDPERFLGSMQWRIYLEVFGADVFRWNVFEARQIAPQHYRLHAFHPLTMHRYPGLSKDVARSLHQFVGFARDFLPERAAA